MLVTSLAVLVTGSVLVVKFDERRLDEQRLARAWPPVSRDNALIGLALLGAPIVGLLAVWYHFFRTRSAALWPPWRWSLKGAGLGLAAVALILAAHAALVLTLAYVLGLPIDQ